MKNKIKGQAIAEIKLRIDLSDVWGTDCTVEQIFSQGKKEP